MDGKVFTVDGSQSNQRLLVTPVCPLSLTTGSLTTSTTVTARITMSTPLTTATITKVSSAPETGISIYPSSTISCSLTSYYYLSHLNCKRFFCPLSSSSSSSSSPSSSSSLLPSLGSSLLLLPPSLGPILRCYSMLLILMILLSFNLTCSGVHGLRIRRPSSIPEICANVTGLTPDQLIACREQSQAVLAVSEGTRKGISECQEQFKNERWNCTPDANSTMFNKTLQRGSQETAFFYAITSSGVVHSLSQTCRTGNITDCGCDQRRFGDLPITSYGASRWKWAGCSDNIEYAMNFAKRFVDSPEEQALKRRPQDPEALMNIHNNQAGRLAVYRKMNKMCRCHGVSGSCEVQTCWRVLPRFSEVGKYLKSKYEGAVKLRKNLRLDGKGNGDRKRTGRRAGLSEDDLVYIRKSPNYCVTDPRLGIQGTSGRRCNKTSKGSDGCEELCCGRGYNTQRVMVQEMCNCRFEWCCQVHCEPCKPREEYIYTCK